MFQTATTRGKDMNKRSWYLISLFNLAIVALLGSSLRSKILFSVPWIVHKNFINAHSHFAFGGWITLSFLALFTYSILPEEKRNRPFYQQMLWGIEVSSLGMLFSFPFQGYGGISIFFSTTFIFFTYGYAWRFIKDVYKSPRTGPGLFLAVAALAYLVISSAGPFTLAYILASKSSNAILYKDSVYFYLHFQYNGFFTLAVFALFATRMTDSLKNNVEVRRFAKILAASVVPSFFLTLLWHSGNFTVRALAFIAVILLVACFIYFIRVVKLKPVVQSFQDPLARILCRLVFVSFALKIILQIGTVFPDLGNAVFGLRPIIIGFLHLVFLGLASFYVLSEYTERGVFQMKKALTGVAWGGFILAVIGQETVLLVQGAGLLTGRSSPVFNWILWIISILLFLFAVLMTISASGSSPGFYLKRNSRHGINL
ncbi:MAG TPA: hypothetical protein VK166_18720 [Chitinophagaceae bacterium]|nr:hypothetical protein [Chitinophagaceae bacterium]